VPDVSLVEIVPGRFLIVISAGTPLTAIEVALEDQIDLLGDGEPRDRAILANVVARLRNARRSNRASLASVVLVDTN
jgi:hypothetical protein